MLYSIHTFLLAVRQEAINHAIQKQKESEDAGNALPAPTKRQSFVNRRKANDNESDRNRNSRNFSHQTTTYQGNSFIYLKIKFEYKFSQSYLNYNKLSTDNQ